MTTFDGLLPEVAAILQSHLSRLQPYLPILVNRDLNGRIRLVVEAAHKPGDAGTVEHPLHQLAAEIHANLGPHTVGLEQVLLFEESLAELINASNTFALQDREGSAMSHIHVADRLAQEATWASIKPEGNGVPRVVFYSIKGGVGRSTALAASAWALAEAGRKVLVLDLDLESPGLSSSLLPFDRQPAYGITDWLVEDLVGNGDAVIKDLFAQSPLARNGEILVVPAHGRDPGEYISKLGRVWMPTFQNDGSRQMWSVRLARLLRELEQTHQPEIVLIDSRAGIDEVASACVTDLGANRVYLFALDGLQTWTGYQLLFHYWLQHGVSQKIRDRLQVVAAMLPSWSDKALTEATESLREQAYSLFIDTVYDEQPGDSEALNEVNIFSYGLTDLDAPHCPLKIRWNQGFAAIQSLHQRLDGVEPNEVKLIYGELIDDLNGLLGPALTL